MVSPRILWRDQHLIAVEKPAGLLSHPGADRSRPDLVSWLREQLPPEEAEQLVMQHRLDRETSGLLLFSLSVAARAPLAQAFAERRIQKTYWAWVKGQPPGQGSWQACLGEKKGRIFVDPGGLTAHTDYRVRQRRAAYCWLVLQPHTGRKHQLRVHCAFAGFPIVGDPLYRGATSTRLWLHAYQLELQHPVSGQALRLQCQPDGWDLPPFLQRA